MIFDVDSQSLPSVQIGPYQHSLWEAALFSNIARILATLALILGLFQLAIGIAIASGTIGPYEQALARYTSASSSGEVIDRATLVIVFAVALGTLAEIGRAIRKLSEN